MAGAIEIGSICVKTTGRSAGKTAVVVDFDKEGFAVIDGTALKRKKCNIRHLLPTGKKVEIKKGASHEEVVKKLKG
ncbi:MAG: 50S ribosomal protein L14e [Candidatus Diapherotrites archaeon]